MASSPIIDPVAQLIEAIHEPVMVLDSMTIAHANAAARGLLGDYIVGEYVRMVLRHPAAMPVLSGEAEGPAPLTGLGGDARAWELTGGTIAPGLRLLRLADRSAARAAEQMRVDFVANASHELRTPLAALVGFIETLGDANGPEEADTRVRFLGIMAGEARRMQRLIDDLMSLSRIEADRYDRPRASVDMAAIVTAACAELAAAGEERVSCSVAPALVEGDAGQLSQLLHNVIGNALKYGRAGTPVMVALANTDEEARLTVADQG